MGWNGEVTYFNQSYRCDRTVVLSLPDGFGSSELIDSECKGPELQDRYLVASDRNGVVSMIPTCAFDWQVSDWRVRHRDYKIVEREVDKDELRFDFVDIPF